MAAPLGRPGGEPRSWFDNSRLDCLVVGVAVGVLSRIPAIPVEAGPRVLVPGLLAVVTTFSALRRERGHDGGNPRQSLGLRIAQLLLGALAASAGWLIGVKL